MSASLYLFRATILVGNLLLACQAFPENWPSQTTSNPQSGGPLIYQRVIEWRKAVAAHDAGKVDDAVIDVSSWSSKQVREVLVQVKGLVRLVVKSRKDAASFTTERRAKALLGLTDEEAQKGNANRVLLRGALLHTDIAILAARLVPTAPGDTSEWMIEDGFKVGKESGQHWEFARTLLDSVDPMPSSDERVRQWYVAVAAHMQNTRHWGLATYHLKRAREIFPADATLLFYSGTLHEGFASPLAQKSKVTASTITFYFGSRKQELERARHYFEEAVSVQAGYAEARLRLGRVLGLLGDHPQAVNELQLAAAGLTENELRYYDDLFLGQEQQEVGHMDAARGSFGSAAKLFPKAQSPRLSLSLLSRWSDRFPDALTALATVISPPANNNPVDDPLWFYDVWQARNANKLISEIRRVIGELPR